MPASRSFRSIVVPFALVALVAAACGDEEQRRAGRGTSGRGGSAGQAGDGAGKSGQGGSPAAGSGGGVHEPNAGAGGEPGEGSGGSSFESGGRRAEAGDSGASGGLAGSAGGSEAGAGGEGECATACAVARVVGGLVTVRQGTGAGAVRVSEHGFEFRPRSCAAVAGGTVCVTGGFRQ